MWKLLFFLQCLYVIGDCLTKVLALGDSLSLQQKEKSIDPLTDYEIVFPVQVDSEGNYLTHQLNPFETYDHDLTRRKQEATDNGSSKVFYSITGFGQQFHLEVFPSTVFLGPGFKVYKLNSNKQRKLFTETPGDEVRNCLYSGRIKQQEESSTIALNVCNGLRGLIQTRDENFLIEPIQEENFNVNRNSSYRSKGIVHKLSKRSVFHNTGSVTELSRTKPQTYYCGQKREYMPRKPRKKTHWLPKEFPLPTRRKREMRANRTNSHDENRHRYLETVVVVDQEMIKKHGADSITTYVLTVFNMVAALYQDPTINNKINLVLVSLVLLDGHEPGLSLTYNAEKSLSSFCQWQSTLHDTKGSYYDHAVLLTGLDICSWKDEPCDTLGFAPISGMCSTYRSCTINEDSGLALAFTVAHEIGHSFGMVHDGKGSKCKNTRGSIMSPVLSGLDGTFKWSACSKKELTKFLESPRSFCLNNKPKQIEYLKFPNVLPGERYDTDLQCKLQFGTRSKLCKLYHEKNDVLQEHNVCKSLWCQTRGRECVTNFMPAAEGTSCGRSMWCKRGKCVMADTNGVRPVNGGWGLFSAWSPCSKTCGGGISFKQRYCDRPKPRNFGRNCQGKDRVYKVCNQKPCLQRSADLQAKQCQAFNNRTFSGKRFLWKPYKKNLGALYRCKIYCMPRKAGIILVLSTNLPDGVVCKPGFSAVCVGGECKKVGCDGIIDSMIQPDVCGICDGDNSTCRLIAGQLKIQRNISGYYTITHIPKHARSIKISEVNESPSYLALRNVIGHYYITGNWTIDWPGRYRVATTEFLYRRWYKQPESLQAEGPTNENLVVEALLRGQEMTVKFSYVLDIEMDKYSIDTELRKSMIKHYEWGLVTSPCSVSCGEGFRYQNYSCFDEMANLVANDLCSSSSKQSLFQITQCNINPCPPTWETGKWGSCSRSCGIGLRHRHVKCVRKLNATTTEQLPSRFCRGERKPVRKEKCNLNLCSVKWETGPWTKCSVNCGEGHQTRNATCVIRRQESNTSVTLFSHFFGRHVHTINCNFIPRPVTTRSCLNYPCPVLKSIVENCVDIYSWCHLVVKYKVCSHDFYSKKCCSSCISMDLE